MRTLAGAAQDDVAVRAAGRDGDKIISWIRRRAHEHLADLEGLGDMADDGGTVTLVKGLCSR